MPELPPLEQFLPQIQQAFEGFMRENLPKIGKTEE